MTAPYCIMPLSQGNLWHIFHGAGGQEGVQPQEGLDFFSLVEGMSVRGTVLPSVQVTACGHRWHRCCLLSLFPFEIYCVGNAASLGIKSSNSVHANVIPHIDVFSQHFCGYIYCLRR